MNIIITFFLKDIIILLSLVSGARLHPTPEFAMKMEVPLPCLSPSPFLNKSKNNSSTLTPTSSSSSSSSTSSSYLLLLLPFLLLLLIIIIIEIIYFFFVFFISSFSSRVTNYLRFLARNGIAVSVQTVKQPEKQRPDTDLV